MKDFAGKITFITGGASGAGLGQAKLFGSLGAKITIADIRQDALDKALEELKGMGIDALGIHLDITDRQQYIAAADKVEEYWGGPPQLLIQTAGVNTFGPAEASTFEDFDWVLGVNLFGVINGMVIFVPRMIKAYNKVDGQISREGAHIAIVSSLGAFSGFATDAPYSCSKAAVNNLAYSYYEALKPYGIGVTVQCPANIRSNIGEAIRTRPAHLANTGYYVSEGTINMLKSIHATGMDPVELAKNLKQAIENELPLAIPYPNAEEILQREFRKVIQYLTVEGLKEQEEEARKLREMQAENFLQMDTTGITGPIEPFGQARPDLDWVLPEKRKQ